MSQEPILSRRLSGTLIYGLGLVLCLALLVWTLRPWRARLDVPYSGGDCLFTCMQVKSMLDNGWYFHNPALGAPGEGQLYDFPILDSLHFAVIKVLALTGLGACALVNLYFLLTFPLTTVTTLFVLRRFGVSAPAALLASLLYTFCPYHFLRNTNHLFLAAYYIIPLVMYVALRLYQDPALLLRWRGPDGRPARALGCLFICALASCSGAYYAFFTGFFLLLAGLASALCHRQLRALVCAAVLLLVLAAGFLANITPSLLYAREHGRNLATGRNNYFAAEIYGLKLAPMLLPVPYHRLHSLAQLRAKYDRRQGVNENLTAYLGTLGALGFIVLLLRLFRRPRAEGSGAVADGLALFNLGAVLLGTVGGLGSLFALLIDPSIRAYNRISICIAFMALFAVALLLDRLGAGWRQRGWAGRLAYLGLCAGLLALGILDQTSRSFLPRYQEYQRSHDSDKAFVEQIETIMPPGSMILQLPLVSFPEGHTAGIDGYEHFRGYLYSRMLRWSFGAIRGRESGHWQAGLEGRPLEEVLPAAAVVGFEGLWLKRAAYAGRPDTEAYLRRTLGTEPLSSADGDFLFFDLRPYVEALRAKSSPAQWSWWRRINRYPLVFSWRKDFWNYEGAGASTWHWCASSHGDIAVLNPAPYARTLRITMRCASAQQGTGYHLTIDAPHYHAGVPLSSALSEEVSWTMQAAPGQSVIHFTCDAPSFTPGGGDSRTLVFRIDTFSAREIDDSDSHLEHDCIQVYEGSL